MRFSWFGFLLFSLVNSCVVASVAAAMTVKEEARGEGDTERDIEEVLVRGDASLARRQGDLGSLGVVDQEQLDLIRQAHVSEALVRVPGVWISRGSGQEHLTAIRSAVLTGAGACGEFLFLENGIPIRPAGFCNVNNLFEVNSEQAAALEVVRGPGSALYGGNALHGAINSVSRLQPEPMRLSLEGGSYGYYQVRYSGTAKQNGQTLLLDMFGSSSNGYRDDTGYGQQKLTLSHIVDGSRWKVRTTLSGSNLNQETGGFVRGFRAYKSSDLKDSNPNPEAYRDAWSLRLTSAWTRSVGDEGELTLTPYVRTSRMRFLQHFLPGQPTEKNGQDSIGMLARLSNTAGELDWQIGLQLEYADAFLREFQELPTTGSAFLVATRPPGLHYDYAVTSRLGAVFYDLEWNLTSNLSLVHSLRLESLAYDYNNNTRVGNSRDDGSFCGFGGCLYNRPADRDDEFDNVAGRVGLNWQLSPQWRTYVTFGTGFRPPQATELYRLQRGQNAADLDSEQLDSLEWGWRFQGPSLELDLALYREKTDHFIFRDAQGFNVSNGQTESRGIEFDVSWRLGERNSFGLAGTYARHQYTFDRAAALGEQIEDGNDQDTAPRWLGSAHWRYLPTQTIESELELTLTDAYFLDAANTARYEGHTLVNWRGSWQVKDRWKLFARVMNLLDREYADRADFAFGGYRYFPGMPRQYYLGVEMKFE